MQWEGHYVKTIEGYLKWWSLIITVTSLPWLWVVHSWKYPFTCECYVNLFLITAKSPNQNKYCTDISVLILWFSSLWINYWTTGISSGIRGNLVITMCSVTSCVIYRSLIYHRPQHCLPSVSEWMSWDRCSPGKPCIPEVACVLCDTVIQCHQSLLHACVQVFPLSPITH